MESSESPKSDVIQHEKIDLSDIPVEPKEEIKPEKKERKTYTKKDKKDFEEKIKFIPLMANAICKFSKTPELKPLEEQWLSSSSLAMLQKYEVGYLEEISFGMCIIEIVGIRLIDKFFDRKEKFEQAREIREKEQHNTSKN